MLSSWQVGGRPHLQSLRNDAGPRRGRHGRGRDARPQQQHQPPSPGIYPDYPAPVVLIGEDGQREMRDMRWGLPSQPG